MRREKLHNSSKPGKAKNIKTRFYTYYFMVTVNLIIILDLVHSDKDTGIKMFFVGEITYAIPLKKRAEEKRPFNFYFIRVIFVVPLKNPLRNEFLNGFTWFNYYADCHYGLAQKSKFLKKTLI